MERVDELRRAATRLSRDFVTMETTRRAYLLTGDEATRQAGAQAEESAVRGFKRMRQLSDRWRSLLPLVEGVATEYRAWVRTGQTELAAREVDARAAALVAARGNADRHFQALWRRQTDLEDQLARAQRASARSQDRTMRPPRTWPSAPP